MYLLGVLLSTFFNVLKRHAKLRGISEHIKEILWLLYVFHSCLCDISAFIIK